MEGEDGTLDRALEQGSPDEDVAEDLARARLRDRLFGRASDPIQIGRYTVLHKLGEGGNGIVYSAYDDRLNRKVALKVVRSDRVHDPKRARSRLLAEAQALAKLAHPNIVTVFEVFVDEAQDVVIAMEFVDGMTLQQWATQPGRTWEQILAIYRDAGQGLAAAHAAGMTHRDFKPTNALVGDDGRVRVLDFGLVRVAPGAMTPSGDLRSMSAEDRPLPPDASEGATVADTGRDSGNRQSRTGVVGTPLYMPPEQHRGAGADARSDQYSFCASVWEALLDHPPFDGTSLRELYAEKMQHQLEAPTQTPVPGRIVEALVRGLSPDPQARFDSMDALLEALVWNPTARRRRWLTLLAVMTAAAAGVGYGTLAEETPCQDVGFSMQTLWSPARSGDVESVFRATNTPYAEPSWATARELIDGWTTAWVDARRDACLAHARGEQSAEMLDLRTACLDDRQRELEALLDVFAAADATVVEKAVRATRALPGVDRCADVDALRSAVAPPEDPAVAKRVEELRIVLARSRANIDAGRYDRAIELADEVLTEIGSASWSYPPVRARALLLRGDATSHSGNLPKSLQLIREGTLLAQEVGDREAFVKGAIDLVWEFGDSRTDYDLAHTWADMARSTLAQMGGRDDLRARLHNNVGAVLTNEQRYDEALAEHRARLALVGEAGGEAFLSLTNIANIYNYRGEWKLATDTYQQAIDVASRELGANHPRILMIRGNLVGIMWRSEPPEVARSYGDRLLAEQRAVYGEVHPSLITTYANLANIAAAQNDTESERRFATESLRLTEVVYGPDHHYAIPGLIRLTHLEIAARNWQAARDHADNTLRIARKTRGDDHIDVGYALENLGSLELAVGNIDTALEHYEETVRIVVVSDGPQQLAAAAESYSAQALCEQGKPLDALRVATSSLDRFERHEGSDTDILLAKDRTAQALVDLGRYDDALEIIEENVSRWAARGDEEARRGAAFDRMRAEVAMGRTTGDPEAARALLEGVNNTVFERRVEAWLRSRP